MDVSGANEACLRAFGEAVAVAGRPVRAIVSAPVTAHELAPTGRERAPLRLDMERPVLRLAEADAEGIASGDLVEVRGRTYAVARVRRDGAGLAEVSLTPVGGKEAAGPWR